MTEIVNLPVDEDLKYVLDMVRRVMLPHKGQEVAGCTFMVWNVDGSSTCQTDIKDGSRIPSILVPDFVRNRLLAERIERWAVDAVNANSSGAS